MKTQNGTSKTLRAALILVLTCAAMCVQQAYGQDPWNPPAQCNAAKPTSSDVLPGGLCEGAQVAQCTRNTGDTSCTGLPSSCGQWTVPINICNPVPLSDKCVGVHAALLYTGNVLFWYKTGPDNQNTNSFVVNPTNCPGGNCTPIDVSPTGFNYDILCAGMSAGTAHNTSGTIIATGGMGNSPNEGSGIKNTSFFTPSGGSGSWVAGLTAENMECTRFYPSNVVQPSGNVMTLAGTDPADPDPYCAAKGMELWAGVAWASTGPNGPQQMSLYPRLKLVPENQGEFVMAGENQETFIYDPPLSQWQDVGHMTFGNNRSQGGAVILPLASGTPNTQILAAGGNTGTEGSGCPTNTAEIFAATARTWGPTPGNQCMCYARYNENLVLLANGTVLAVGGGNGQGENYSGPIPAPELYDPITGTWTVLAADLDQNNKIVNRTYHSTALLLPDGRVISAGSDTKTKGLPGTNDNKFQIFSPPYIFAATRPVMGSVSATNITWGQTFDINTADASSTLKAALIRPGATTHAEDFEQRYVNLAVTQVTQGVKITVRAPANGGVAPPGYYMLFIVNSSGVPSVSGTSTISPQAFMQLQ